MSVIIPNYNYARTLSLCLEAVRKQTYPAVEVIVADDHSTDNSVAVAQQAGARVVQTPRRASGCAEGRNTGVAHAHGEVLFFLDSDVALEPDAVENAVAILAADPAVGAVCGVYHPDPLVVDSKVEEYRSLQLHYWQVTSEGSVSNMYPAMTAMRRSAFDAVGPFNPRLKQTEDADYGHRVSQRYTLLLDSKVSGKHDHDDKLSTLLWKVYTRTRLRIPLYALRRRFAKGFETATRGWGCIAAFATVPALIAATVLGPLWLVLPVVLFAFSVATDVGMYRFVWRRRGSRFLLFYVAMQYLANITIASGLAVGVLQWLTSRSFRRLYDTLQLEPRRAGV
ncbi:glycosyltransferase family 2 protein [Streptomyces sp. ADMS]|uniref:glycosyltransferase family A protein n=1 Tax=Streptomyces sp. ADMS TaxID=3071415 RepID=UPI00296E5C2C|nr:glycosyltransferase family 2 protein [Streptomyces sp. ADMS]MDW4910797.1 glycosyltransferase family 2 protein [Streptomyces sp. ADMS]